MLGCTKTTNIYSWLIDQYFFVTSTYFRFGFSRVVFLPKKSNALITMVNVTNKYLFIKTCLLLNKLFCQHFLSLWNSPTPFPNKAVSAQVCTYVLHRPVAMLYSSFGQLTIYITNQDSQETNRCQKYQKNKKKQFIAQIKYGSYLGTIQGGGGATRRWLLAVQKKSHVRMNRPAFRSKIRNQMYAYQRRQLGNFGVSEQLWKQSL